jgi:hypothetical protein
MRRAAFGQHQPSRISLHIYVPGPHKSFRGSSVAMHAGGWPAKVLLTCTLATLSALMAGCAHRPKPEVIASEDAADNQTEAGAVLALPRSEMAKAAMQPLEDVGLKRERIPPTLKAIEFPYDAGAAPTCDSLAQEILALDQVLGDDVDVALADPSWRRKGVEAANDALVNALESTSTSVIPMRGVVRRLTGASYRERQMTAAIQAGRLKRAFLKGMGQAKGCAPPAAPLPAADEDK